MNLTTLSRRPGILLALVLLHISVIAASNYLVQLPIEIWGVHLTWGALSYPFIFLATDLTIRAFGASLARRIVFCVMFPALAVSYFFSVVFQQGSFVGWNALAHVDVLVLRIVLASFTAYIAGQLLDIFVFRKLVNRFAWWVAPGASAFFGNLVDTLVFFSIAFAGSSNIFMANHWPEIAATDYACKVIFCLGLFVPIYGMLLRWLRGWLPQRAQVSS